MKKLLLLAAGALMSLSASAQWAVVGSYCDWSFQTATTFQGEGDNLSCTINHLTSGFKIVDITNDNWDVQYGSATPIEIGKACVLDGKNGGEDPADMTFANGVFAVDNAVVTWNPTTATLTINGDPKSQEVDESLIYLVGQPNGWSINESSYVLKAVEPGVYQGVFNIAAGSNIYFRFYTALGDWGGNAALPSIGALPNDDTNTPVQFTDGVYNGPCEPGKGSWVLPSWDGGDITMLVDMNNWKVSFSIGDAGVDSIIDSDASAVYYNLQGVKVNNPQRGIYIVNGKKVVLR